MAAMEIKTVLIKAMKRIVQIAPKVVLTNANVMTTTVAQKDKHLATLKRVNSNKCEPILAVYCLYKYFFTAYNLLVPNHFERDQIKSLSVLKFII